MVKEYRRSPKIIGIILCLLGSTFDEGDLFLGQLVQLIDQLINGLVGGGY